ncbi:MAG: Uma2 family endonuclease [Planctomycetota bacterium]
MSTSARLTAAEFDAMVDNGAFDSIGPKKIELIRGELRIMNPAGPIHSDYINYLTRWSTNNTTEAEATISVQNGFVCADNRPEPDVLWLKPGRYSQRRPTAEDVLLLIEVADSSLSSDLQEKADIYAESGVQEYWVVDIPGSRLHIMAESDGSSYRSIQVVVPPNEPSPSYKPSAKLNLAELFEMQ